MMTIPFESSKDDVITAKIENNFFGHFDSTRQSEEGLSTLAFGLAGDVKPRIEAILQLSFAQQPADAAASRIKGALRSCI